MQKLKVTTSAHSWSTVRIRNSLVCILQVTATTCFQFSYQYWIKDGQEISDGIKAIRSASSNEEAKAAWEDLQSFIYEYGAASVIGHFTNITAMNSKVENYQYLRFPIYWNITFAE